MVFEFHRLRFRFLASEPLAFPAGLAANVLRGGLGTALRDAAPAAVYARLFRPCAESGPSGLADPPRPFVLRAAHLDGCSIPAGKNFDFEVNVFDLAEPAGEWFGRAFDHLARQGLGRGRGRAALLDVEELDLAGNRAARPTCRLELGPGESATGARIRFLTPTEWKSAGAVPGCPDFAVLFARVRDRIATLTSLYGRQPLAADFRGLGARAAAVRLLRHDLRWVAFERRSSRTGQVHPLSGFTGEAFYQGELGEFLPWLRAAYWTGVGRQTVWGKGMIATEAVPS